MKKVFLTLLFLAMLAAIGALLYLWQSEKCRADGFEAKYAELRDRPDRNLFDQLGDTTRSVKSTAKKAWTFGGWVADKIRKK